MDCGRIDRFSLVDSRFMHQSVSVKPPNPSDNVGTHPINPADKTYKPQDGRETCFPLNDDSTMETRHPKKVEFLQDRPFFCERCWKGYYSKHNFEEHVRQHVKCSFCGCGFEALPYRVAKHIINMHSNADFPMGRVLRPKGLRQKYNANRTTGQWKEPHDDIATTSFGHSREDDEEQAPEPKRLAQLEQHGSSESTFRGLDKSMNGAGIAPKVKFELRHASCPLEKISKEEMCYEKALLLQCTRYAVDHLLSASKDR